jgi:PAS domain S-box-containing protein
MAKKRPRESFYKNRKTTPEVVTEPPRVTTPIGWSMDSDVLSGWDRYFELFNSAPVGYLLLDMNGIVAEINQAGCRLLNASASQVLRRPMLVLVTRDHRHDFLEHMRRVRHSAETIECEIVLQFRDGPSIPVRLSSRRSPHAERPMCWTVMIDLTEQRRLTLDRQRAERERLQAEHEELAARTRSAAKDRFLATLSHELRTPLTPALFAASMLMSLPGLPEIARRSAETIKRNIELEARLIDDLLDVTRVARDKLQLDRSIIDVHAVVRDSLAICSLAADTKNVRLHFEPSALRLRVDADPLRLRQVFWNLIDNAIKFTPSGGSVVVGTSNDEAGTVRVSVTDSGVGVDPDRIPALFTPFEQSGDRRGNRGLGLGLAICKGIVEAHGGWIGGSSRGPGQGATFEVELATVSDSMPTTEMTVLHHALTRSEPHARLRILIVEDHKDSADLLQAWLSDEGHEVHIEHTLQAAVARATEPWDVLVSDLGLPDGSGLDVARAFRAHTNPACRMIALSGYGAPADIEASQRAGFDFHVVKPAGVSRIPELLQAPVPTQ